MTNRQLIMPGQIVVSTAGRDSGSAYVVVGTVHPHSLLLSDGRTHRLERPKKKNIRHVEHQATDQLIAEKLHSGAAITNEELRQALTSYAKSVNQ